MEKGYKRQEIGISHSKELRIKLKDKFNRFFDSYEREHIGYSFDKNYDKIRKSITKYVSILDTAHFIPILGWQIGPLS